VPGFRNARRLAESFSAGKTWISTFRKVPAVTATIAGQWFDFSYAGGNPIPNYYAAAPLQPALLEPEKGIIVPLMVNGERQFLHRLTVMSAGATTGFMPLCLCDYLLYYPFCDMDAAGEDQAITQPAVPVNLTRSTDGLGVQMIVVAQSPTLGGGRFTITYIDSDDVQRTTISMFCAAAQPAGAFVNAVLGAGGLTPFVPLAAGTKGVKRVVSVNFSVANGGLCAIVLVKPIQWTQTLESCAVAGVGAAVETEALRLRGGMEEIKSGAFLGLIGQGTAGSLASSPLVGTIETVWG
jgi:hypothetical protein